MKHAQVVVDLAYCRLCLLHVSGLHRPRVVLTTAKTFDYLLEISVICLPRIIWNYVGPGRDTILRL